MSLPAPGIAGRGLVLAAGLGTRLRPLTYVRAKAAVPVNGDPLARRAIRWLVGHGITDLVLNLHHRPQTIAACVGDGSDLGAHVRYSWEQPVLGSAGGPRHALPLLAGPGGSADTFVIVNADTLTDLDVTAMVVEHRRAGALVTMALIPNPRPDKYGGVSVSPDGWVTGFTRRGTAAQSYHFIGVQIAEPEVFASLEDRVPAESVNAWYPSMIARRPTSIRGFVSDASFRDIGTPADYLRTSVELATREGDLLAFGSGITRAPSARIVRSALWDDVVIGRDVELVDCIVCDGVRVPDFARYERCALVAAADGDPLRLEPDTAAGERIHGDLLVSPFRL